MENLDTSKKIMLAGLIVVLFVIAMAVGQRKQTQPPQPDGASTASSSANLTQTAKKVTFDCPDGRAIIATFHLPKDETVDIDLGDGKVITLKHALAASGARYSNADESYVFWNKGNAAFIEQNGKIVHDNCVTEVATSSASQR
ncbi:MliC family protein [Patescibacteria group bacterium]|nr:MliC family protein [Patescibacteria group bacterium]MCL5091261.1 MliC family protein [Patescibacteria group bacterium]